MAGPYHRHAVRADPTRHVPHGQPPEEAGREAQELRTRVTLTRPFYLVALRGDAGGVAARDGQQPEPVPGLRPRCPVESVNWFEDIAQFIGG